MVTGNPHDYDMTDAVSRDVDARVFVTDPDNPEDALTFVWAGTRWHERVEGPSGAVEFPPIPEDEPALRRRLGERGLDLTELDDEFADLVREEFGEQAVLYPEAPEYSDQSPEVEEADLGAEGGTRF